MGMDLSQPIAWPFRPTHAENQVAQQPQNRSANHSPTMNEALAIVQKGTGIDPVPSAANGPGASEIPGNPDPGQPHPPGDDQSTRMFTESAMGNVPCLLLRTSRHPLPIRNRFPTQPSAMETHAASAASRLPPLPIRTRHPKPMHRILHRCHKHIENSRIRTKTDRFRRCDIQGADRHRCRTDRLSRTRCWGWTWTSRRIWASTPSSAWKSFPPWKNACPTCPRSPRTWSAP
jgi:hypothetical protein